MSEDKEYSITDFNKILSSWYLYLKSKFIWILLIGIISGLVGIYYASQQKPVYTAQLTFVSDISRPGMGAYSGLASQFGLEIGGGGGESVFEGDNLMVLMRSNFLIQKTFLTKINIDGKNQLLVDYFIEKKGFRNSWNANPALSKITFDNFRPGDRNRDSIMKVFYNIVVGTALSIDRIDRRLNIIVATLNDTDEPFAKVFVEQLVSNVIQYYTNFKIEKAKENLQILQRQTDSVRSLVNGNLVSIATSNDLNVNPLRELPRANVQRKGIDVQINTQLYGELVKNLELSRMTLQKETPLIQIIDSPVLPLDKRKMGRLKGALIFSFIGASIALLFFIIRKFFVKQKGHIIAQSSLL